MCDIASDNKRRLNSNRKSKSLLRKVDAVESDEDPEADEDLQPQPQLSYEDLSHFLVINMNNDKESPVTSPHQMMKFKCFL